MGNPTRKGKFADIWIFTHFAKVEPIQEVVIVVLYKHICVCACLYTHTHTNTHTDRYIHVCVCVCVCVYGHVLFRDKMQL